MKNDSGPLSSRLAAYVGGLRVPQGTHAGKPLRVLPWERRVLDLFDSPGDIAVGIARRNGKSILGAALACAAIDPDGPLAYPGSDSVIVASSFAQATITLRFVRRLMADQLADRGRFRVLDSQNKAGIEHRETGSRLLVLGSNPARAHGLAVRVAILDEMAQWDASKRDKMLAVLRTSAGTIPGSRLIMVGTRPAEAHHPFAVMLAGPRGLSFAPDDECDPMDPENWAAANPSMCEPEFAELRAVIAREAAEAEADPVLMAGFKSLRLNLGTSEALVASLIEAEVWRRIEREDTPRTGAYVLALDRGGSAAMTALAAYWWETGALDCLACFPERPSLEVRGKRDHVGALYQEMQDCGDLLVAGKRTPDVGALFGEALRRWGRPSCVVSDWFQGAETRDDLDRIRFPRVPFVTRGNGFKDGSEDVRRFRKGCLDGEVHPRPSLLLRAAMREARVVADSGGNTKMSKQTQGGRRRLGRDDAAAAAVLSCAEGMRRKASPPRRRRIAVT